VTPANIAINDISIKTRFCGLHFRCRKCSCIFNHFYVICPESYRIRQITRRLGLLRRSRSSKVTEFGTNPKLICDFLLVINTNLAPILHCFRDISFDRSKIAIFGYPFCLTPPTEGFPWDDFRKILPGCQQMASVPNGVKKLRKISITRVGHTNVTDRQTTDGRTTTYSEHELEFTFAKMECWRKIAKIMHK